MIIAARILGSRTLIVSAMASRYKNKLSSYLIGYSEMLVAAVPKRAFNHSVIAGSRAQPLLIFIGEFLVWCRLLCEAPLSS